MRLKVRTDRILSYPHVPVPVFIIALVAFFTFPTQAKADPVYLQTGIATGHTWLILLAGLSLEALVITLFIKRPITKSLPVVLMANAITGFIGYIALLLFRIGGAQIFPPGPATVIATLIEAPIITVLLVKPPVFRLWTGVATANIIGYLVAFTIFNQFTIAPENPSAEDDLLLSRGLIEIKNGVELYHSEYGFYPKTLMGGSIVTSVEESVDTDPLLRSGILESYPTNPYAPYIRSHKYNPNWLLTGAGPATLPVRLDEPTNSWEARWFPTISDDPRFGDPDHLLLCANGLSDPDVRDSVARTYYHMNGADVVPGCFFYKSYDFNNDGLPDDYILGAYGWPTGSGTVAIDIIDGATGEICLSSSACGQITAGHPDGTPESVVMLYVENTPID